MTNVILQALNCKVDQVAGLVPIIDADGHPLACLENGEQKLLLLPTIEQYKSVEIELANMLRQMRKLRIPPAAKVSKLNHVDGNVYYMVTILLPPCASVQLTLVEELHMQLIPKMFRQRQQATGVAADIMEALAGGVVDWTTVKNMDMC